MWGFGRTQLVAFTILLKYKSTRQIYTRYVVPTKNTTQQENVLKYNYKLSKNGCPGKMYEYLAGRTYFGR